jgi:hypothetical protein
MFLTNAESWNVVLLSLGVFQAIVWSRCFEDTETTLTSSAISLTVSIDSQKKTEGLVGNTKIITVSLLLPHLAYEGRCRTTKHAALIQLCSHFLPELACNLGVNRLAIVGIIGRNYLFSPLGKQKKKWFVTFITLMHSFVFS